MRLFILLCLLMPFSAYSYNSLGHMVVAEVAYKMLSDKKQEMLDDLAMTIQDEGDNANLCRKFKGVSTYSKSAMLADRVAGDRLSDVYDRFGAEVPEPLKAYAGETTESWHQPIRTLGTDVDRSPEKCEHDNGGQIAPQGKISGHSGTTRRTAWKARRRSTVRSQRDQILEKHRSQ